jgi:hypothetical protein
LGPPKRCALLLRAGVLQPPSLLVVSCEAGTLMPVASALPPKHW